MQREHLRESATHTTCPWKGVASYYDVVVGDEVNKDAAWYYPEPKDAATDITRLHRVLARRLRRAFLELRTPSTQLVRVAQQVRHDHAGDGIVQQARVFSWRGVPARRSRGRIWRSPVGMGITSCTVLGASGADAVEVHHLGDGGIHQLAVGPAPDDDEVGLSGFWAT